MQKNVYLQNGAEHIALVATAPPPIVVTAAPKHLLSKVCEILTLSLQSSTVHIHMKMSHQQLEE